MNKHAALQMDAFDDRQAPRSAGRPGIIKYSPLPPHVPIFVSDNISDHLGYEPGEVIGNPNFLINTVHPDDFAQFISSLFHLFIRGFHLYDYRLLRKDRSISRMIVELRLHRDHTGAPVSITGTYADPSLLAGKTWSAYPFSTASSADKMEVIDLMVDSSGNFRRVSRAVRDVLGYRPDELIGKSVLKIIPSDYHVLLRQTLARMLDSCMDTLFFWTAARHQNGTIRFLANECKGFNDDRGERSFNARCYDITERLNDAQASFSAFREEEPGSPGSSDPYEVLTIREREILALVVQGHSSTRIGARLSISPRTVEAHRANLMKKLRVTSSSQLIRYACCCNALPSAK